MRGFRRPPAVEYDVCGGMHTGGDSAAQSAASFATVQGVVPSAQRGALSRTAPYRPPSKRASMRSSVSDDGGVPAVLPPPPSSRTRPRSFLYPGSIGPRPVKSKSVAA